MASSDQPDALAQAVAIFVGCVAAYVSIASKILRKRKKISKLWLSTEIGFCILAGYIGWETYDGLSSYIPIFSNMSKELYCIVCIYMGSRLVILLEKRTENAITSV